MNERIERAKNSSINMDHASVTFCWPFSSVANPAIYSILVCDLALEPEARPAIII